MSNDKNTTAPKNQAEQADKVAGDEMASERSEHSDAAKPAGK